MLDLMSMTKDWLEVGVLLKWLLFKYTHLKATALTGTLDQSLYEEKNTCFYKILNLLSDSQ